VTRADGPRTGRGIPMTAVLCVNAVVALGLGVVLLAATWTGLFTHLSKFPAGPVDLPSARRGGVLGAGVDAPIRGQGPGRPHDARLRARRS
jgi:hypothetical protein